ncbi:hypothetical protein LTR56_012423 [Elasticomyces elasticus]|nr:hypothetical protein LTR22_020806 [Elasticomyces elasticus]KAK3639452.1 hypothetical protein LTR56_012423 [Elasticomyces elasticus]KAK4909629.1 hypothetical protein LTR49_021603 [Elasticomyces elasticus]KAK5752714.1 hypothetical protein LTS12_017186 [Elasticomyces elasticus]
MAAEGQTCTGCRKQKTPEEFWRRNRNNLTCNQCSERLRIRKAQVAAARKAKLQGGGKPQPQPMHLQPQVVAQQQMASVAGPQ